MESPKPANDNKTDDIKGQHLCAKRQKPPDYWAVFAFQQKIGCQSDKGIIRRDRSPTGEEQSRCHILMIVHIENTIIEHQMVNRDRQHQKNTEQFKVGLPFFFLLRHLFCL